MNCLAFNSAADPKSDCCMEKNPCAKGWERLGDKCFFISGKKDQISSFDEGEARCKSLYPTAHLASIQSKAEQDWIVETVEMQFLYIGATDQKTEGVWHWVDGTPWDYTNWAPNQPDNSMNEGCGMIWLWYE